MAIPTARVRPRRLLALLVVTALALLTLDFRNVAIVSTARGGVQQAFDPLLNATRWVGDSTSELWNGATKYDELKAENDVLRTELARERDDAILEQDARVALDELLAQSEIATATGAEQVLSRVISGPVSNFENTLRIDKGSDDGVLRGMTVISSAGLVGRILEVTGSRAVVELVDSQDFAVGVRQAGQTRQSFVARGQGRGEQLVLQGTVDDDAGLEPGDVMVTSGLDLSVYPPDIVVGRVADISSSAPGEVNLDLTVDANTLTFVTVVLWDAA